MIARQISFFAPAFVMSAWATVMLHTFATGHINRLLSPMFSGCVPVAGILLLLLSALYALLYQPAAEAAPTLASTGRFRQFGRWLVLLIPVVAAAVLSPPALSSATMINHGLNPPTGVPSVPSWQEVNLDRVEQVLDAEPSQPVPVEVSDLITISRSSTKIATFSGRKVRCSGLLITQSSHPSKLVRGLMTCCAADIVPLSVDLRYSPTGNWKDSQWIEVTGTAEFPSTLGLVVPTIKVDTVTPTQEPDDPYLYPNP